MDRTTFVLSTQPLHQAYLRNRGLGVLLNGSKETPHWAVLDRLRFWGAEPVSKRIVESGKIITAAGIETFTAKVCGPQVAQILQLGIE